MKELDTWVVEPIYIIQMNKKKRKVIKGMIIAFSKERAEEIRDEYIASGLECSIAWKTIIIKGVEDNEE